jgi:hypothetical protein
MKNETEQNFDSISHAVNLIKRKYEEQKTITRSEINHAVMELTENQQNAALAEINLFSLSHGQKLENLTE